MEARFCAVDRLDQRVPVGTAKYDIGIGEIGDVSFTTLPSEALNRFASTKKTTKTSRCSARWGLCDRLAGAENIIRSPGQGRCISGPCGVCRTIDNRQRLENQRSPGWS
jgi:hypothetical protein